LAQSDPEIRKKLEEKKKKRVKVKRMTRRRFKRWCEKFLKNAKLREQIQENDDEMDSWGDVSCNRAAVNKNSGEVLNHHWPSTIN